MLTRGLELTLCLTVGTTLLLGCERQRTEEAKPPANEGPRPEAAPSPSAPKSPPEQSPLNDESAPEPEPDVRCLTEQEVKEYDPLGFLLGGKQNVIRVARDDTLSLRKSATSSAPLVLALAPNRADLAPTGAVCLVGKTPWWEVRAGAETGWVNSKFVGRLTAPHDGLERARARLGKGAESETPAKTPWDLTQRILKGMNTPPQAEGRYEAELIDLNTAGASATATVHACCELDDSVAGEQTLLSMTREERGWVLTGASMRFLCSRGVTSDGKLCT